MNLKQQIEEWETDNKSLQKALGEAYSSSRFDKYDQTMTALKEAEEIIFMATERGDTSRFFERLTKARIWRKKWGFSNE